MNKDILTILILILATTAAFGLGRLSVEKPLESKNMSEIRIGEIDLETMPASSYAALQQEKMSEMPTSTEAEKRAQEEQNKGLNERIVASKSGTKYYLESCSGAKRIKEENKVYFETFLEAREAGYEPALNCPGLE